MSRHRFQIRLRTLFVVMTVVAVACWYVGGQLRIVRIRAGFIKSHPQYDFGDSSDWLDDDGLPLVKQQIPWIRRILGDRQWGVIELPNENTVEQRQEVRRLFPEAELLRTIDSHRSETIPDD
jgi:hypothetical protein